jgi:hypothetical protein
MNARIPLLIIVLVLATACLSAMISTLPLPELVRRAHVICHAKVAQISEIAIDSEQISTVKNVLMPVKVLKGDWIPQEPIVVMTKQCGTAGQIGWLEDQVDFPPVGHHVVVFLEKAEDGSLRTVNSVQGVWPLLEDLKTPLGMGQGFSLKDVTDLISSQKP